MKESDIGSKVTKVPKKREGLMSHATPWICRFLVIVELSGWIFVIRTLSK